LWHKVNKLNVNGYKLYFIEFIFSSKILLECKGFSKYNQEIKIALTHKIMINKE